MHSPRYSAFISYRHEDNTQKRRWAEWFHPGVERYVVSPGLKGTPNLRGEPNADAPAKAR